MEFGKDEQGHEILLKDDRFQVMMEWEKPYMEACIDALKPSGDVLEVGFGCGYSANQIQKYKPKSHTIIEYHPVVAKKARAWAKKFPHVTIVEDTWQHAIKKLGSFDAIFFDDYPLESEREMRILEKKVDDANLVLRSGKKKMQELEKQLSFLRTMQYSDQDLDQFFALLPQQEHTEAKVLVRFFYELKDAGNISEVQLVACIQRLKNGGYLTEQDLQLFKAEQKTERLAAQVEVRGDRLFEFLQTCLAKHMRKGARFSCYLNEPTSKYEDDKFFNLIITNPFLEYHEERIHVDVPSNCNYYKENEALVIVITKVS